jgi:hypothetical protein
VVAAGGEPVDGQAFLDDGVVAGVKLLEYLAVFEYLTFDKYPFTL